MSRKKDFDGLQLTTFFWRSEMRVAGLGAYRYTWFIFVCRDRVWKMTAVRRYYNCGRSYREPRHTTRSCRVAWRQPECSYAEGRYRFSRLIGVAHVRIRGRHATPRHRCTNKYECQLLRSIVTKSFKEVCTVRDFCPVLSLDSESPSALQLCKKLLRFMSKRSTAQKKESKKTLVATRCRFRMTNVSIH